MERYRYIAKRLLTAIPTFLGITILVYVVASLAPSSPLEILFNDPYATAEEMARKSKELGLDQPVIIQYIRWLVQLVQGNMGMSIRTNGQVLDMILERIGPTLILTGSAMALTIIIALQWYTQMFDSRSIMSALTTTLIIAFVSALVATVIGTAAAISISSMRTVPRTIVMGVTNIPMLNADIVTGISLMLAFIAFGISLGFKTVLISHITFNIPYVILSVMPKLKQTDKYTYEAALDLGASPLYAFFKVVFPDIMPGVLSGFLLAFTMSLDDFIITHFTKGAGINTLSTLIYSEVRRGIRPSMYALSSIIFLTVLILLIFVTFRSIKKPEKA